MDPQKRILTLSRELLRHQYLYYVKAQPEISDEAYDRLFDELLELEKKYPHLAHENSPTRRIGSDLDNSFPEKEHSIPVLSLDKVYTTSNLMEWIDKISDAVGRAPGIVVEDKIDGASIVLYYRDGQLQTALTRGNGYSGNDVTANVRTIHQVPLHLNEQTNIAVRGEIFIAKADFHSYNREFGERYANPRNLAAGSLRNVKSSVVARVPLQFCAHEAFILNHDMALSAQPAYHMTILAKLESLGIRIGSSIDLFLPAETSVPEVTGLTVSAYDDLPAVLEDRKQRREQVEYEIDGLVVKVNETDLRTRLGVTAHHPRWALAFKFDSPLAVTTLREIHVQVGRNGRVTPVAFLDAVNVGGSSISRATLHNQDYIDMLELGPGDRVTISRRGDVIPAVEEVVEKNPDKPTVYRLPDRCPFCDTDLVKEGGHHFCKNQHCPERLKRRLIHFTGKSGMDIDGLGEKTVELLFDRGFVRDCADIYYFDYRKLLSEDGFKEKKVENIIRGVENSKKQPFQRVLAALGFEGLGTTMAADLVAQGFNSIDKLLDVASEDDVSKLAAVDGVGELSARLLIEQFSEPANIALLKRLRDAGVTLQASDRNANRTDQRFEGQVWVITGTLDHFKPRSRAAEEIRKRGGEISTTISGRTTHLLCGRSPGSKLEKARSQSVKIIEEDEFRVMLE